MKNHILDYSFAIGGIGLSVGLFETQFSFFGKMGFLAAYMILVNLLWEILKELKKINSE